MSTARYTLLLDFQGGTYVSQTEAADEIEAVRLWCGQMAASAPAGRASASLAKALRKGLEVDPPVALEALTGVWCMTAVHGRSLALLNIVRSV